MINLHSIGQTFGTLTDLRNGSIQAFTHDSESNTVYAVTSASQFCGLPARPEQVLDGTLLLAETSEPSAIVYLQ